MSDEETVSLSNAERRSRRTMILIGVIVAVVLIAIIAGFVLMIQAGTTGTVRDVVIILMALESLLVGGLLLVLIYQITALMKMLREEIKPLIESAQDTVRSARGTTTFVGKKIVSPAITVAGSVAGVGRIVAVLIKRKK